MNKINIPENVFWGWLNGQMDNANKYKQIRPALYSEYSARWQALNDVRNFIKSNLKQ